MYNIVELKMKGKGKDEILHKIKFFSNFAPLTFALSVRGV